MKLLFQLIAFLTSAMLLCAFIAGVYERWSASQGPATTAVILSKTDYVPRKAVVHTYTLQLAFKPRAADSVITDTEVSHHAYLSSNQKGLTTINYQAYNPKNVVLASEEWFQWNSLGVLALGMTLLFAGITVKEGKRKQAV